MKMILKIKKIYDYLIFKLKFFIKHNKSVAVIWILFLSFLLWYYKNNDIIEITNTIKYVFPSCVALTGLLYVSFTHNLRNGMYEKEIKLLSELMNKSVEIIQNVQSRRQLDLINHGVIIEGYQKKFQNGNYYILGAAEQHELIFYLTSLLNSSSCVYLPPKIKKEIHELHKKNVEILYSKIEHLKYLSVNNIKIKNSECNLIKNNELLIKKYEGYVVSIGTFKQFFNEAEIKKLKLTGIDISKYNDNDVIIFNIDENTFKELNTLIYKIYSLASEKIEKISEFAKF